MRPPGRLQRSSDQQPSGNFVSLNTLSYGAACRALAATVAIAPILFGCATPPTNPAERAAFEQTNDPLEPMNRKILDANMVLDKILLKPAAKIYVTILPEKARDALHRVLENLKDPVIVINNVLQGRFKSAGITVGRFTVNSTIGLGGLLDIANKWGLKSQPADFGQTLYVWGLPQGPYLVLPVLGPSNPRDSIGMGVDALIDPFGYLATTEDVDDLQITRFVLGGIDQRARVLNVLDDLQKNSLDFYAELRSLSQQQRAAELRRGEPAAPTPNFYRDPGKAAPGAATPKPDTSLPAPNFYDDPGATAPRAPTSRNTPASPPPIPAATPATPAPRSNLAAPVAAAAAAPSGDNAGDEGPLAGQPVRSAAER